MTQPALQLLSAAGALLLVLGAILAAQRLLQRSQLGVRHDPARGLSVLDTLALDPRRRVLLISCRERRILLLLGGSSDALLASWTEPGA